MKMYKAGARKGEAGDGELEAACEPWEDSGSMKPHVCLSAAAKEQPQPLC